MVRFVRRRWTKKIHVPFPTQSGQLYACNCHVGRQLKALRRACAGRLPSRGGAHTQRLVKWSKLGQTSGQSDPIVAHKLASTTSPRGCPRSDGVHASIPDPYPEDIAT